MMDFMCSSLLKNDLIIGESSQISNYMSSELVRVSSRNIPNHIYQTNWERVYICFAEQRTVYAHDIAFKEEFNKINVDLTLEVVKKINAKEIVYFSTVELWSNCSGAISLNTDFDFEENYYTISKYKAAKILKEIENVIILYPFNFNSRYRSSNFLMGKIFQSLLCKKKIEVGNLDWNRDILHAKWVASQAEITKQSQIIGSGTYFNVREYAKDLYKKFNMNYEEYVFESSQSSQKKLTYLSSEKILYSYDQLLSDTLLDLKQAYL